MVTKILPYSNGSKSAKALARGLGLRRWGHNDFQFDNLLDQIICWGVPPDYLAHDIQLRHLNDGLVVINRPDVVRAASNKKKFFEHISRANINYTLDRLDEFITRTPDWTADSRLAANWVNRQGNPELVVCRSVLSGHSGEGIELYRADDPNLHDPKFKLFTRYVKKSQEYRVHLAYPIDEERRVVDGPLLIGVQRKLRVLDNENPNWQIRNFQNGFVYSYEDVYPRDVQVQAINALRASGLHFGAVDVVWNEARQEATVLEINTAPGLSPVSVDLYVSAFSDLYL